MSVSDALTNQEWVDAMKVEIDSLRNNNGRYESVDWITGIVDYWTDLVGTSSPKVWGRNLRMRIKITVPRGSGVLTPGTYM